MAQYACILTLTSSRSDWMWRGSYIYNQSHSHTSHITRLTPRRSSKAETMRGGRRRQSKSPMHDDEGEEEVKRAWRYPASRRGETRGGKIAPWEERHQEYHDTRSGRPTHNNGSKRWAPHPTEVREREKQRDKTRYDDRNFRSTSGTNTTGSSAWADGDRADGGSRRHKTRRAESRSPARNPVKSDSKSKNRPRPRSPGERFKRSTSTEHAKGKRDADTEELPTAASGSSNSPERTKESKGSHRVDLQRDIHNVWDLRSRIATLADHHRGDRLLAGRTIRETSPNTIRSLPLLTPQKDTRMVKVDNVLRAREGKAHSPSLSPSRIPFECGGLAGMENISPMRVQLGEPVSKTRLDDTTLDPPVAIGKKKIRMGSTPEVTNESAEDDDSSSTATIEYEVDTNNQDPAAEDANVAGSDALTHAPNSPQTISRRGVGRGPAPGANIGNPTPPLAGPPVVIDIDEGALLEDKVLFTCPRCGYNTEIRLAALRVTTARGVLCAKCGRVNMFRWPDTQPGAVA